MADSGIVRLSKHHGAGNDFLVSVDAAGTGAFTAAEVRALCDRHRGIGADGLLRATPGPLPGTLSMELLNTDGSGAEMSGNGVRCLVHAAVRTGLVEAGTVVVHTAAGPRTVRFRHQDQAGLGYATVDMGAVVLGEELSVPDVVTARAARHVRVGNPHVVLLVDGADDDLVAHAGARISRSVPGGANVEFAWPGPEHGALTMRVWERGVGPTLACGTGACAAASAAHAWGLVGTRVRVHDVGGTLEVTLDGGAAELAGPTQWVADVEVERSVLAQLAKDDAAIGRSGERGETGVARLEASEVAIRS